MDTTPRLKVCCISTEAEARLAIRLGASALGLVSAMPSGPGPIPERLIARIAAAVPKETDTFLLTSLTDPQAIAEQHRRCGTTTLQLVDHMRHEDLAALRLLVPGVRLVQVIHVSDANSVDEALAYAPIVDALLLDSGRPNAAVRELGGTGRVHDWSISRSIVEQAACPVWLAGGLNSENAGEAVRKVRPYGLDLCSGIRTNGALDEEKLTRFVAAVRRAFLGSTS
jgi:phosphoribosylanthranilate isomerase